MKPLLVPHTKSILAYLLSKNWVIDGIEELDGQPFNYLVKPPNSLEITDVAFRYKIPVEDEDDPAFWEYLNVISMGIASIYQMNQSDLDKLFLKPLHKVLDKELMVR